MEHNTNGPWGLIIRSTDDLAVAPTVGEGDPFADIIGLASAGGNAADLDNEHANDLSRTYENEP